MQLRRNCKAIFLIRYCQQAHHTEPDANHLVNLATVYKVLINPQLVLCYYNVLLNATHGLDSIICKFITY